MIIALAGKGGVGKTSLAGILIDELARRHYKQKLLVIDADPAPYPQHKGFRFGLAQESVTARTETIALADEHLRLPMFGFTRSYNVSVSVAIALAALVPLLHRSSLPWELTPHEKEDLTLTWYRRIVRRHQDLEERFVADWAAGGSSNS